MRILPAFSASQGNQTQQNIVHITTAKGVEERLPKEELKAATAFLLQVSILPPLSNGDTVALIHFLLARCAFLPLGSSASGDCDLITSGEMKPSPRPPLTAPFFL